MVLYVQELMKAVARCMEARWHEPADKAVDKRLDLHEPVRWWQDEQTVCGSLGDVARDTRYWQKRCELLHKVSELGESAEDRLAVPYPSYESAPLKSTTSKEAEKETRRFRVCLDHRFKELGLRLSDDANGAILRSARREEKLMARIHDVGGEIPQELRTACGKRAALWRQLGEWLGKAPDERLDPNNPDPKLLKEDLEELNECIQRFADPSSAASNA